MSLSERMSKAGGADKPVRHLAPVDGLSGFKVSISNELFERLGQRLFETQNEEQLRATVVAEIETIMAAEEAPLTSEERARLVQEIARDVMGYGPIEPFLADPSVTEVMVNGTELHLHRARWCDRGDQRPVHLRTSTFGGSSTASSTRSAGGSMRPVPMVDARLPDGSRVNVIVPPLSLDGSILTIRKFAKDPFQAS